MSTAKISLITFSLLILTMTSCGSLNNSRIKYRKTHRASIKKAAPPMESNKLVAFQKHKILVEPIIINDRKSEVNNTQKRNLAEDLIKRTTPIDTLKNSECDVIVMKSGKEIKAKVFEIDMHTIKYKKCDLPDGPTYIVNSNEISTITYPNGFTENIVQTTKESKPQKKPKSSIVGFIFGIVGSSLGLFILAVTSNIYFVIPLAFALLALILAIVSFILFKVKPDSKSHRVLAIISAIAGSISLFLTSIFFFFLVFI